jgi:Mg2+/Co2+ transporter CorB
LLASYYGGRGENAAPLIATGVLLVFGEIVPKFIGTSLADKLVYAYSLPLRFFMSFFSPVIAVVGAVVKKLSPLWTPAVTEPDVTDEELVTMVDSMRRRLHRKVSELSIPIDLWTYALTFVPASMSAPSTSSTLLD